MDLSEPQKRYLRRLGHHLKPVALTGAAGLKPSLLEEIDRALAHHELIKVRFRAPDRLTRDEMVQQVCAELDAALVQRVGHVALLFRRNPEEPRITLPR